MTKYEPLERFLGSRNDAEIPMTFDEIESIIGASLPPAAGRHRAWWSNNPSNNVMTKSWLSAGFITERVDLASRKVVFRRSKNANSPARRPAEGLKVRIGFLDRFRARLGGTVTIPDGVDPAEPTGEVWDAER